jgi:molybdenum cofactor cytidylyltransferase
MIFAELPVPEATGAILVHSVKLKGTSFKKGRVLSAADIETLIAGGIATVTAARLEPGDLGEDEAARRIAQAACGDNAEVAAPFTGRCNIIARSAGVLLVDRERIDRINLIDEAVTLATLPAYDLVEPRQMVATIKIIPFAVSGPIVERCLEILREGPPLIGVAALRPRSVGVIQTRLPGMKESILDKTTDVINARLAALGCGPAIERRCAHDEAALTAEIGAMAAEKVALVMIVGASAITDRRDVIPAAIEASGGTVEHLGMPVDPGNLLLLGHRGEVPVLGLPGCARSPKLNGFDWVLQRIIADVPVTRRDIMLMGAGGLLKEIPTRPQPRAGDTAPPDKVKAQRAPSIAAIVLAAGKSSRMRGANKLLAEVDGTAMVVRAVDTALASKARPVVVVTGNDAERVTAVLAGKPVTVIHNPDYADGISTSLKRGLAALPADVDGALICLADMPRLAPATLDRLIAAFNPVEGRAICLPTWNGKRGNPVLWARRFFPEMAELAGDVGARHLIGEHADLVCEVSMPDDSILTDIDTPEALAALRASQVPPPLAGGG